MAGDAKHAHSFEVMKDVLGGREMRGSRITGVLTKLLDCMCDVGASSEGGIHEGADDGLVEGVEVSVFGSVVC